MNLPADYTRCLGLHCPERQQCERHLQLARDAAAAVERVPVCETLRSVPGGVCGWKMAAEGVAA